MANFHEWVDKYFATETVGGTEYVTVYEEDNQDRTIEYDIKLGDLYAMFGETVEAADDIDEVSADDIRDELDPSWGYDRIVDDWENNDIIV